MKLVNKCQESNRPKILGLSATLLNANVKKQRGSDFNKQLRELEETFDGKIITAKNCQEIRARSGTRNFHRLNIRMVFAGCN